MRGYEAETEQSLGARNKPTYADLVRIGRERYQAEDRDQRTKQAPQEAAGSPRLGALTDGLECQLGRSAGRANLLSVGGLRPLRLA